MKYQKIIQLKDGRTCTIRNAVEEDAEKIIADYKKAHGETDFLLTYPDEKSFDIDEEKRFILDVEKSDCDVELCAVVEGRIIGTAGISKIGTKEKIKHRADLGISVEKEFWHLGIGRALTSVCIECAEQAGYQQLELEVVAHNTNAVNLYKSLGFIEYGRNPRGLKSRTDGWQEMILMRMEMN